MPQPAPKKRSGCRTLFLIIALGVIVLVGVGGYLGWRFLNDEVLPGIQESTGPFSPLSESPPGPCFDLESEGGILTEWDEVPCEGTRQVEVSFAATFEDGLYPGDDFLTDTAASTCLTAFENYVGVSPEQSAYDVDWLLPTEDMWIDGVRNGICLVVADDGSTLSGTIKGSET